MAVCALLFVGCSPPREPRPPPPAPRHESLFGLCQTMVARESHDASPQDLRELEEARALFRARVPVRLDARLSRVEALNERVGLSVAQGELVVLEMTASVPVPEARGFSLQPFFALDGNRWGSAAPGVRDNGVASRSADLVRALFARTPPPVLPPREARTTTGAGEKEHAHFSHKDAVEKVFTLSFCADVSDEGQCEALTPMARRGPSLGAEVFGLELFVQLTEGIGECALNITYSVPLPPGATPGERVGSLFEAGPLTLGGGATP
jgi:hypothetical protein